MKINDIITESNDNDLQGEYRGHESKSNKGKDFKKMRVAIQQDYDGVVEMASYDGNIGIMELAKFFVLAKQKGDFKLVQKVRDLIANGSKKTDKMAWKIVQDYTGTQLVGDQFHESISELLLKRTK